MWHKAVGVLGATLDSLAVNFPDKEVMIVETAAYYSHEKDQWAKSADQYSEFYPISTEGQRIFTHELVAELRRHANVTGLFWWFPEENACGNTVTEGWLNRGLLIIALVIASGDEGIQWVYPLTSSKVVNGLNCILIIMNAQI